MLQFSLRERERGLSIGRAHLPSDRVDDEPVHPQVWRHERMPLHDIDGRQHRVINALEALEPLVDVDAGGFQGCEAVFAHARLDDFTARAVRIDVAHAAVSVPDDVHLRGVKLVESDDD